LAVSQRCSGFFLICFCRFLVTMFYHSLALSLQSYKEGESRHRKNLKPLKICVVAESFTDSKFPCNRPRIFSMGNFSLNKGWGATPPRPPICFPVNFVQLAVHGYPCRLIIFFLSYSLYSALLEFIWKSEIGTFICISIHSFRACILNNCY